MNKALAAFDKEWKDSNATKDRTKAREMAKEFVSANKDSLEATVQVAVRALREAKLDDPVTREDLVGLVSVYRAKGDEEGRILADMLLLDGYEPQNIVGVGAMVRTIPDLMKKG